MHGSGDAFPDHVNPATVQLLSELTCQYIGNLVDAAVDSQQLLAGNEATIPPPPPYPRNRQPRLPSAPPDPPKKDEEETTTTGKKEKDKDKDKDKETAVVPKKRPRRPDVDYWDESLPEPKIVKRSSSADPSHPIGVAGVTAFHSPHQQQQQMAGKNTATADKEEKKPVHIDEWVGVAGVDFWEQSRSRAAHVRMPQAIGVQCFIFPICHDGFLYGKVMQVQASRRAIAPILTDQTLMDYVRTEGRLKHAPRRKKKESKKPSGDADVEEEPEQQEEEPEQDEGAMWPGLEFLLPVHQLKAITEG